MVAPEPHAGWFPGEPINFGAVDLHALLSERCHRHSIFRSCDMEVV
jgi:hypothetical protein